MWVYWGKLGHLKTSGQEGAVLEPQLQGTQKGGGAGLAGRAKSEKMCSGPFYWPLGGIVLTFLQRTGQLPLIPSPRANCQSQGAQQGVPSVCLGPATRGPGVPVTAQSLHPWSLSPTLLCLCFVIHPMGRDHVFCPALSPALSTVPACDRCPVNIRQMKY